jgi:hypothetical protein
MKLRIKGNSVRLRLGQSEVRRLANGEVVEEATKFGPLKQQCFTYALSASHEVSMVYASFSDRRITVRVPSDMVHHWATTDQIGIETVQRTGNEDGLQILIEKDFECIDGAPGESQEDAFPNPQLEAACPPAVSMERSR